VGFRFSFGIFVVWVGAIASKPGSRRPHRPHRPHRNCGELAGIVGLFDVSGFWVQLWDFCCLGWRYRQQAGSYRGCLWGLASGVGLEIFRGYLSVRIWVNGFRFEADNYSLPFTSIPFFRSSEGSSCPPKFRRPCIAGPFFRLWITWMQQHPKLTPLDLHVRAI